MISTKGKKERIFERPPLKQVRMWSHEAGGLSLEVPYDSMEKMDQSGNIAVLKRYSPLPPWRWSFGL